jgi:hypothetical protein
MPRKVMFGGEAVRRLASSVRLKALAGVTLTTAAVMVMGGTAFADRSPLLDGNNGASYDCQAGAPGPAQYGTANVRTSGSSGHVRIRISGADPNESYDVTYTPKDTFGGCSIHSVGTVTTGSRGSGSGGFDFTVSPSDVAFNFSVTDGNSNPGSYLGTQEFTI